MYRYDPIDQRLVDERVAQFRDQMARFLAGRLSEDEFRPLRLQNGLYLQRHAPMLRVAIPYGTLSSPQLRQLARIARLYDRGYGHFTTRCNIQFNWVRLEDTPEILAELATVQMHAIQTSGNCIRNITSDPFAGASADEVFDPRPSCELLRQWSALAPEFLFLPRKFKIAVSGGETDRAAVRFHDIGARAVRQPDGALGFELYVGGGLGRTPMVGQLLTPFLPRAELLNYCEAILRVYNRHGRRDNKYKARLKILVKDLGLAEFARQVEEEWAYARGGPNTVTEAEFRYMEQFFTPPAAPPEVEDDGVYREAKARDRAFARWLERNVAPHREAGCAIVTLSLKKTGSPPGDASADQMEAVAQLAERYGNGEIRVSHEQNLVLPRVPRRHLPALWQEARQAGLATPNIGLLTDVTCCPGGDFCSLANAKSIPVAAAIQERFDDLDYLFDLGPVELNISGCVNACGHHHIGHIGILGVEKNDEEWYQVTLGGREGVDGALGKVIGPAFVAERIPDIIARLLETYVAHRHEDETFSQALARLGPEPFKESVYGPPQG